jgi:hypothetical protein
MAGGIIIPVLTEFNDKGVKQGIKSLKSLVASQVGVAASGTALLELSRRSIKAAMEDAAAQKQLSLAITNNTGATSQQVAEIEKNVAAMQYQYAVADDELRPALASLTRVTGNLTQSQTLLESALNISAATGRDVESVSLALGKAYQGNYKALKSMGLSISDSAMKSKDFAQVMAEVDAATAGAGETFAKTAQGGMAKLSIKAADLQENVGNNLLSVIVPAAEAIQKLGEKSEEASKKSGLLSSVMGGLKDAIMTQIPGLTQLVWLLSDNSEKTDDLTTASAGLFRMYEQSGSKAFEFYAAQQKKANDKTDKTSKTVDKQKQKLAELARVAREKAAAELERLTGVYDGLISKADDYRMSVSDQITGFISLADAVQTAEQSDSAYNDALVERKNAYEELTAIQEERKRRGFDIGDPNITYDANDYADALDRIAKAEQGVTDAQSKRVDYTAAFRTQITAAKEFASNLQVLAAGDPPLGSMGIAQLLNLGPVAGNQVAKDLLSGLAGLTVSDINSTLASLSTASNLAGLQAASNDFGSQIQTAGRNIQATGNTPAPNIYVTVQQTDPRAVVDALRDYNWLSGGIPISIGTLV